MSKKFQTIPSPFATTSRESYMDSTPLETECTPSFIFFSLQEIQCQNPMGRNLRGRSKQDGWYLLPHLLPQQYLKYSSTLIKQKQTITKNAVITNELNFLKENEKRIGL